MTTAASPQVAGRDTPLSLAELIDLEVQLATDLDADSSALIARDTAIGEAIGAAGISQKRHALLRAWLGAVGATGPGSVGRRVQGFYRIVGWIGAVVSLCGGAGTAAALLRYDGRDPINIINFLAVLVGLQLLLIAVSVLAMFPAPWRRRAVRLGGLQEMVRDLGYRRAGLMATLQNRGLLGAKGAAALGRLAALHGVYAGVERWSLTALTQRAAVAFNVGALAVCLYLVTVRALAFAWSTTLEVDPELMARVFRAIATPWSVVSAAVPDRDLVEASRYFPGHAYDADRLGDWWPFLFAALTTYGLLPRIALAAYASYRQRAARRSLALDHGECADVYARLLRTTVGWGRGADVGPEVPSEGRSDGGSALSPLPASMGSVHGIRWADAEISHEEAARLLTGRYRWNLESFDDSAGDGGQGDAAVLSRLAADRDQAPVLLIAEAWEPPSKNLTYFLRALRKACGRERAVVVGLLTKGAERSGTSLDDVRIWRRRVSALGDPRIRVEALDA
jgi:hypothetical protein